MGQEILPERDPAVIRRFTRAVLTDLQALERMVSEGLIESGIRRIGAEQEMFLVDDRWSPAPRSTEVLETLAPCFTTELARFNLEVNLDPLVFEDDCFSRLEQDMAARVQTAREAARRLGVDVVLTGILPTLTKSDMTLENITPRTRYYALNEAMNRLRNGSYRLRIEGTDELHFEHDSVMLEACNTSAQFHLQVTADEFVPFYNLAQAVTAPLMAASVNSPLLFGRRLWEETRIALFQQSIDTRSSKLHTREMSPRVRFGERWLDGSVVELFAEDISRFRPLVAVAIEEDSMAVLDRGGVPSLRALQVHNGTIYRWNRPCYGAGGGVPHLRIECRVLPSGPTVLDEVANAAFWIGMIMGAAREWGDVRERLAFADARANFVAASRSGLRAGFRWLDGQAVAAPELILKHLLPLARRGLMESAIDVDDVDRYLGVIHDRVASGQTGASWIIRSLAGLNTSVKRAEQVRLLTAAMIARQATGAPVHEWELATMHETTGPRQDFRRVEQYMTTDLYTVGADELVDLVAFLMDKNHIRHILVEDDQNELVGIVSYRSLLRLVAQGRYGPTDEGLSARDLMHSNPITVSPETPTLEALETMRVNKVSALPVVKDGKLVGIVSERDFIPVAAALLEQTLRKD